MTGMFEVLGEIFGKILVITEGVMDNWVTVVGANIQAWDLTSSGVLFTAEVSNIVEKVVQLIEQILETWFGVAPYA